MSIDVPTPHGPARVHLHAAERPRAVLALGHGAGGGVGARDLAAARDAALAAGVSVALVEQPYRVAGRRSPAPAARLDAAWLAVVRRLCEQEARGLPLLAGGRSSGARVACRTAAEAGAIGVLCLAFPLLPPARRGSTAPRPSRLPELEAVPVPVLVVQGASDPFGIPPDAPGRSVVVLRGTHALTSDLPGLRAAVGAWLEGVLAASDRR